MCAPSASKPGGIQCSPSYSESSDYSIACVFGKITPCVCVCVCVLVTWEMYGMREVHCDI